MSGSHAHISQRCNPVGWHQCLVKLWLACGLHLIVCEGKPDVLVFALLGAGRPGCLGLAGALLLGESCLFSRDAGCGHTGFAEGTRLLLDAVKVEAWKIVYRLVIIAQFNAKPLFLFLINYYKNVANGLKDLVQMLTAVQMPCHVSGRLL